MLTSLITLIAKLTVIVGTWSLLAMCVYFAFPVVPTALMGAAAVFGTIGLFTR